MRTNSRLRGGWKSDKKGLSEAEQRERDIHVAKMMARQGAKEADVYPSLRDRK